MFDNNHFTLFEERVWHAFAADLPEFTNTVERDQDKVYRVVSPTDDNEHKRTVTVSRVNDKGFFQVELKEVLVDPSYTVQHHDLYVHHHDDQQMAGAFRRIRSFLREPIDPKKLPPKELLLKAGDITQGWMSRTATKVALYLDSHEFGEDWRFKIVSANYPHIVFCDAIDPATADGPICATIMRAYQDGQQAGRIETATRIAEQAALEAFRNVTKITGVQVRDLPPKAQQLLRNTSFLDQLK